eukprot:354857-Chlamydomonas_euryale.AAC.5
MDGLPCVMNAPMQVMRALTSAVPSPCRRLLTNLCVQVCKQVVGEHSETPHSRDRRCRWAQLHHRTLRRVGRWAYTAGVHILHANRVHEILRLRGVHHVALVAQRVADVVDRGSVRARLCYLRRATTDGRPLTTCDLHRRACGRHALAEADPGSLTRPWHARICPRCLLCGYSIAQYSVPAAAGLGRRPHARHLLM